MSAKHFIELSNRRMEVRCLRPVYGGVQVETVRAYPSAGVVKGQQFTLAHEHIIKLTARQQRDIARAKSHNKRMKALAKDAKKALEGSESDSESPKSSARSQTSGCPVCGQEHAVGLCTMNNVLDGK